jgi:tetratricopeptide (TPR) repeat protein
MPIQKCLQLHSKAMKILNQSGPLHEYEVRDAVSLLVLANETAKRELQWNSWPMTNSLIAKLYFNLKEFELAKRYAEAGLQEYPDNFDSQWVITGLASYNLFSVTLKNYGLGFLPDGFEKIDFIGMAGKIGLAAFKGGKAAYSQAAFKKEFEKLLDIFSRICKSGTTASEFCRMSKELIIIGDWFVGKKVPATAGSPELIYREVESASYCHLNYSGDPNITMI